MRNSKVWSASLWVIQLQKKIRYLGQTIGSETIIG